MKLYNLPQNPQYKPVKQTLEGHIEKNDILSRLTANKRELICSKMELLASRWWSPILGQPSISRAN